MPLFTVNLQCNTKNFDYKNFDQIIQSYPMWYSIVQNSWLIRTSETPTEIYEKLRFNMGQDDFIYILEVANNSAGWLPEKDWKYIDDMF